MEAERTTMKQFMKGASLLTLATLVVKILSAIYRVPYQNMVGDEGFYVYQQVYPFIGIIVIWTSYGVAVALSKMLAERVEEERRVVRQIALRLLIVGSIAFWVILQLGAPLLAQWMGDFQLVPLLRNVSWLALLIAPIALMKGELQADGRMDVIAKSNVIEQFVRVAIVIASAALVTTSGLSIYDAGKYAVLGSVVGSLVATYTLWKVYRLSPKQQPSISYGAFTGVRRELVTLSISLSASSLILLLFQLVDSFTVFQALSVHETVQESMRLKGIYDRGQPFVQLGILVATSLSLAIVPMIAHYEKQRRYRSTESMTQLTIRIAVVFGVAATVGLWLVLPPLNVLLFEHNEGVLALRIFILQIVLLSVIFPLTAILQGKGYVGYPIVIFVIGIVLKSVITTPLTVEYGIVGSSLSSVIGLTLITICILIVFRRHVVRGVLGKQYVSILSSATLFMVVTVQLTLSLLPVVTSHERLQAMVETFASVGVGGASFLFVVLRYRMIREKEWYMVPFGKQLAKLQLMIGKKR